MQKVQIQIADIETAYQLNLVTTIYQDQIVTTIKKSERKDWIFKIKKGLKLTGFIAQTRFLPKTVMITDIDDTNYDYFKEVA
tara:strand:- start:59 stop:304 length:246 start_codon:yes stop_codon:yes gene_type:complete